MFGLFQPEDFAGIFCFLGERGYNYFGGTCYLDPPTYVTLISKGFNNKDKFGAVLNHKKVFNVEILIGLIGMTFDQYFC